MRNWVTANNHVAEALYARDTRLHSQGHTFDHTFGSLNGFRSPVVILDRTVKHRVISLPTSSDRPSLHRLTPMPGAGPNPQQELQI